MMENGKFLVTILGEEREYECGTTYLTIANEYQDKVKGDIVLVYVNGKLQELHKSLQKDCEIRFVTTADDIGSKTYKRGASFLAVKSFYDVVGRDDLEKIRIQCSLEKGLYCEMKGNVPLTQELLDRVKARMHELVEKDIPIKKRSVGTDEAIEIFRRHGMKDKEKLFRYRRASQVNIYSINEFEDYYYGYMVPSTGYLKYFDLYLYKGGFVIQLPEQSNPEVVPPFEPPHKLFRILTELSEYEKVTGISSVGELNEYVTQRNAQELVLVQEALQEKKIAKIAEQIAADPQKKFVLVAGPSSSGKTTFSHRLSIQLLANGMVPHAIAVDNYFVDRENTLLDEDGKLNFECIEAVDVKQLNEDLTRLLKGETVEIPTFNFKTGKREYKGNYKKLGEHDILVIEGIHCLNDALTYDLPKENKFKIYISALTQLNIDEHNRIPSTDGRLLRRMVRDARTRGSSAKQTISMWKSVRRGEENNIFPYQEEADVMFNSALLYELAVLKHYAEPILFGIEKDCEEYVEAKRLLKFLDYFVGIGSSDIPTNSLLREFIGGGCFEL